MDYRSGSRMLQYSSPTLEDYTHFCRGNQNLYFVKLTYFVETLFILRKNWTTSVLFVNILVVYFEVSWILILKIPLGLLSFWIGCNCLGNHNVSL